MKFFRILGRSIRDAFKSVGRNFSLSLASIICITVTLIIVSLSLIISYNVKSITKELENDLEIVVFVSNNADEYDINTVEKNIKGISNVLNVTYKSKSEIKEEMMEQYETFKVIMSEWTEAENPLQNTYLVKLKDVSKISDTANKIKNLKDVTLVKYGEEMVEQLLDIFDMLQEFSKYSVIALVIVTVFLIVNTIKLTIFSRKNEIGIMRLVGASNIAIKVPFVTEGIILGIVGSIVPICLVIFGYTKLYDHLGGKLFTNVLNLATPNSLIYNISIVILAIGVIVGMFGSLGAVKKYLKV